MKDGLVRRVVDDLPRPDPVVMDRAGSGDPTQALHDGAAHQIAALHAIEMRPARHRMPATANLRVATWNLERGKHIEASAALLRRTGATVLMLSEMDLGMARSGQRHTTRDLAEALGFGYAFGVEFVELGHGLGRELEHAGEPNAVGLHGNAILSALDLHDPTLVRLEQPGAWFGRDWHHRRIGGRMALAATLQTGRRPLTVVSTHLENVGSADERRRQVEAILAWLASSVPDAPVIVAGDLNTSDLPDAGADRSWMESAATYEPLFDALQGAGFAWCAANQAEHTRRHIDDGRPLPRLRRVDWFFTRGVTASNPQTWPAIDDAGQPVSDHELITVDIAVETG